MRRISRKTSEIAGWIGTLFVLGAYTLLSLNVLDNNSVPYHLIVATGSLLLIYITYLQRSFQPLVINIVFGGLSIIAIIRIVLFS